MPKTELAKFTATPYSNPTLNAHCELATLPAPLIFCTRMPKLYGVAALSETTSLALLAE